MPLERRLVVFGRLPDRPDLDALLSTRGFQVYTVESEQELLDIFQFSKPDAIILLGEPDRGLLTRLSALPEWLGATITAVMWPGVPTQEVVELLDMGVDYVSGSFQPDWLAAQLRALMRRIGQERAAPGIIDLEHLRIDLAERRVMVGGQDVSLTRTEFSILRVLAERPGTVLPSGEIIQQIMGVRMSEAEAQHLLKVHIHRLRQKLEKNPNNPRFIRTVRGHGYMYAFERRARDREAPELADQASG